MGSGDGLEFSWDEDFEDDLKRIKQEDRSRFDTVKTRCEKIRKKPFTGEWKGHKMAGLYGAHVANHWVILYELRPDMAPNGDKGNIREIYFHRVIHHDKQDSAVTNISSVGSSIGCEIRIPYADATTGYDDVPAVASEIRNRELILVEDEQWDNDGVQLEGKLAEIDDAQTQLEALLPGAAEISYYEPSISDIVD